jgi:hypothetical protein
LLPSLFQTNASQRVKIEDQLIYLDNPQAFVDLHKGLSTSPNILSPIGESKKNFKVKWENNDKIWKDWWDKKMKTNIDLINAAKNGNYEEVCKLIDTNFNKD